MTHPCMSPTTVTGALTWTTLDSRIRTSFVFSHISRTRASCRSCFRRSCWIQASRSKGAMQLRLRLLFSAAYYLIRRSYFVFSPSPTISLFHIYLTFVGQHSSSMRWGEKLSALSHTWLSSTKSRLSINATHRDFCAPARRSGSSKVHRYFRRINILLLCFLVLSALPFVKTWPDGDHCYYQFT